MNKTFGIRMSTEYEAWALKHFYHQMEMAVRHDFSPLMMNPKNVGLEFNLYGPDDHKLSQKEYFQEVEHLASLAFNYEQPGTFYENEFSADQPTAQAFCYHVAAAMITSKAGKGKRVIHPASGYEWSREEFARLNIAKYIHPATISTQKEFNTFVFMIDSVAYYLKNCAGPEPLPFYFTKMVKNSVPHVTRRQVRDLFLKQDFESRYIPGKLFDRDLPLPEVSDVYYQIMKAMSVDYLRAMHI